jgi:hypothetical protein
MVAAASSMATAAMAASAMTRGVRQTGRDTTNQEGKSDSRRDPAYLGAQCLFSLGQYFHSDPPRRSD